MAEDCRRRARRRLRGAHSLELPGPSRPIDDRDAVADKKIVVVLPFRVIGANKEEGLYSEGVSVVLTSNLAQLGLPDLQDAVDRGARRESIPSKRRGPNSVRRSCCRVWSSFPAARCELHIP